MIRTTFAANPRRRTVLTAKTAVVSAVVLAVGLATSVACFQFGQWILRGNGFNYEGGYPAVTLADHEALRAVLGSGVYLGLLAVFSTARRRDPAPHRRRDHPCPRGHARARDRVGFLPENIGDQVGEVLAHGRRASLSSRRSIARTTSRSVPARGWSSWPRTPSSRSRSPSG